ncbi:hypothetical protein JOE11_005373 [Robbsia andropogonis]|uniref:hypothetical protein n=1 Tax=Robbsia andropogonis TaxID=28092 RepID=UPI003D22AF2B
MAAYLPVIVCGPGNVAGVQYLHSSSALARQDCGTDSSGNTLYPYVSNQLVMVDAATSPTMADGTSAGLVIGAAVLAALASVYGLRLILNFINSSAEA